MPISVSEEPKSVTIPSETSVSSASTSLDMREISTPAAPARVEADRHRLQVAEELDPQVLQRALADPADEVGLRVGRAPVDERRDHERDDDPASAPSRSPGTMPSSIASLASGGGASAAAVANTSETNISDDPPAVRRQQRREPADLAPAPGGRAPAADEIVRERWRS